MKILMCRYSYGDAEEAGRRFKALCLGPIRVVAPTLEDFAMAVDLAKAARCEWRRALDVAIGKRIAKGEEF